MVVISTLGSTYHRASKLSAQQNFPQRRCSECMLQGFTSSMISGAVKDLTGKSLHTLHLLKYHAVKTTKFPSVQLQDVYVIYSNKQRHAPQVNTVHGYYDCIPKLLPQTAEAEATIL